MFLKISASGPLEMHVAVIVVYFFLRGERVIKLQPCGFVMVRKTKNFRSNFLCFSASAAPGDLYKLFPTRLHASTYTALG